MEIRLTDAGIAVNDYKEIAMIRVWLLTFLMGMGMQPETCQAKENLSFLQDAGRVFVGTLATKKKAWFSDDEFHLEFKIDRWLQGRGKPSPEELRFSANQPDAKVGQTYLIATSLASGELSAMIPLAPDSSLPEQVDALLNDRIRDDIDIFHIVSFLMPHLNLKQNWLRIYRFDRTPAMDQYSTTFSTTGQDGEPREITMIEAAQGRRISPYLEFARVEKKSETERLYYGQDDQGKTFKAEINRTEGDAHLTGLWYPGDRKIYEDD